MGKNRTTRVTDLGSFQYEADLWQQWGFAEMKVYPVTFFGINFPSGVFPPLASDACEEKVLRDFGKKFVSLLV